MDTEDTTVNGEFRMYAAERQWTSRDALHQQHMAIPSLEEIRYAEQLRVQIRESYLKGSEPPQLCG